MKRCIAIGNTARHIIARAILVTVRGDIQDAAGPLHSVCESLLQDDTEAALLVDASNAFNSINRLLALHNIRYLCPSISTVLINCYRAPTSLFIEYDTIYSQEGTTQGDPLRMLLQRCR